MQLRQMRASLCYTDGSSEIAELLAAMTVDVVCSVCSDPAAFPFVFSTVQHKVATITLGSLLQLYLGEAPSAGPGR